MLGQPRKIELAILYTTSGFNWNDCPLLHAGPEPGCSLTEGWSQQSLKYLGLMEIFFFFFTKLVSEGPSPWHAEFWEDSCFLSLIFRNPGLPCEGLLETLGRGLSLDKVGRV